MQIVNFHLVSSVVVPKPELAKKTATGRSLQQAVLGTRKVDFDQHGIHEATIYDGLELDPGVTVSGPTVIQEPAVTLVVQPDHQVTVDDYGNYHVIMSYGGESRG